MLFRHKSRFIALFAIALIALAATPAGTNAQDSDINPNIANCRPLTNPDEQWTMGLEDSHAGWRFVNSIYRTCTQVRSFLDRLSAHVTPGQAVSAEDMYEASEDVAVAQAPLSERLSAYVDRARESVRALFTGEQPQSRIEDGIYYEGQFDNQLSGAGISINPDGVVARGAFQNGRLNGDGQTISSNGAMAAGQFQNDALDGDGARRASDGIEIAGTFDNGHPVGYTEITYPDGSRQRVLYDNNGTELARGARAAAGIIAENPDDPRQTASTALPSADPCATEHQTALAALFGPSPTQDQDAALEQQVAASGLNGDLATVQQGWRDFATAVGANAGEAAGNAYSACRFHARLLQLNPSTDFQALLADDATDRLFASLPTRGGSSAGADMLRDSTDPARRAAREAERAQQAQQAQADRAQRQARNNAFWNGLLQAAAIGAQAYANYEVQRSAIDTANAAALAQQQAVIAASRQAASQQQASNGGQAYTYVNGQCIGTGCPAVRQTASSADHLRCPDAECPHCPLIPKNSNGTYLLGPHNELADVLDLCTHEEWAYFDRIEPH